MTRTKTHYTASELQQKILPLRERARVQTDWLRKRLETILPAVMQRENLDMWIVTSREYNEDPAILSLLPPPDMTARRRTILVFTRQPDGTLERLTISRYGFGDFYQAVWNPKEEEQFACLARIVRERDPASIGLNYSDTFAFGDGLTHNDLLRITAALDGAHRERLCSAERVAVGWLEQRLPEELAAYDALAEV